MYNKCHLVYILYFMIMILWFMIFETSWRAVWQTDWNKHLHWLSGRVPADKQVLLIDLLYLLSRFCTVLRNIHFFSLWVDVSYHSFTVLSIVHTKLCCTGEANSHYSVKVQLLQKWAIELYNVMTEHTILPCIYTDSHIMQLPGAGVYTCHAPAHISITVYTHICNPKHIFKLQV